MATTKFRLRKSHKDNGANIQLEFNYGKGNRFRYGTGLSILNVKNWDMKKMRVKNVTSERFKTQVNNELNKLQTGIEGFYTTKAITEKELVDNSTLKEYCDIFFNKIDIAEPKDELLPFLKFYAWYIDHYKTHPLPTTGKPLSPGTAKTYKNAYNLLKRFNDKVYSLEYNTITLNFYDDYIQWTQEQDYSVNYIGTHIKILKTILNMATEKGYNHNMDFRKKYFKKPTEQIDNIYLSQNEIKTIFEKDLSEFSGKKVNTLNITIDMLETARDLFLIGCCTGLRVSDYNNLKKEYLFTDENGGQYLRLLTKKGNKPVTIPLNWMVRTILEKYKDQTPNRMPQQHINYCIKIIGELSGINELSCKTITKGGKKIEIRLPKHDLITNHSARRSFCTNAYLAEMPTADIMAISGHSQEKTFYNYIKVNDLDRAIKIGRHKFFNENKN